MHDCIIVGAGAAGLLAGATLHEAGRDVLVLEAGNHIGGRAHTVPLSDGTMVERGAQYIHGPTVATWEFIVRFGLKTHHVPVGTKRPYAVFRDGQWADHDPLAEEAWRRTDEVLRSPNPDNLSFRDALIAAGLTGTILKAAEGTLSIGAPMPPEKLSARNASEIHHAFDSLEDPISGVTRPGNPNFTIVQGYRRLWEDMSRLFPRSIRLDTPVTAVDWSGGHVVAQAAGQRFEARTCIITLPVGILQAGIIEFRPALPQAKLGAINGIGSGGLIKVIAEFDTPWWQDRIGSVPNFRNAAPSAFSNGFMDPFWGRSGPPTLFAFIGTPHVDEITGDEERIRYMFLNALAEMYPNVDLESELVSLDVADWASDPWTRGGISVVPVGYYQLRADLATPTPPMFWAGEATHTRGHAECVHGALETGRRAAFEVLHATQPMYASGPETPLDWLEYSPRMR